jgi:hypothetical protein
LHLEKIFYSIFSRDDNLLGKMHIYGHLNLNKTLTLREFSKWKQSKRLKCYKMGPFHGMSIVYCISFKTSKNWGELLPVYMSIHMYENVVLVSQPDLLVYVRPVVPLKDNSPTSSSVHH